MLARSRLAAFIALLFLIAAPPSRAAEKTPRDSDASQYLETIETLKDQPIDGQIEGWNRFVREHPDSKFREEIQQNVRSLEDLQSNSDPSQKKEKKDTEQYLRAVEFAKKLSPQDQILMWEQFLDENPRSIFRRDAKQTLEGLRSKNLKAPAFKPAPSSVKQPSQEERVAPDLAYKDKQTAVLLATFPGIIVPGIAHWYTGEYVTAGILTGLRIVGLAIGIPGLINQDNTRIIAGSLLFGFSYLADVVDAPFAVERYNDSLEKKKGLARRGSDILISFRF